MALPLSYGSVALRAAAPDDDERRDETPDDRDPAETEAKGGSHAEASPDP